MNWVEVLGYVASALIVVSLMMTSVVRLRMISLIGSLVFVAYGLLIGAWPVVLSNGAITLINLFYLQRELSRSDAVTAVPMERDAPFLADFLDAMGEDIAKSQPGFAQDGAGSFVRLINRNGLPAGVFIAEPMGRELHVKLDYVTPRYRDSGSARWLFGRGRSTFTDAGFDRLVAHSQTSAHSHYLEMMGFRREGSAHVLELA